MACRRRAGCRHRGSRRTVSCPGHRSRGPQAARGRSGSAPAISSTGACSTWNTHSCRTGVDTIRRCASAMRRSSRTPATRIWPPGNRSSPPAAKPWPRNATAYLARLAAPAGFDRRRLARSADHAWSTTAAGTRQNAARALSPTIAAGTADIGRPNWVRIVAMSSSRSRIDRPRTTCRAASKSWLPPGLMLAQLEIQEQERPGRSALLLDDPAAELDGENLARLMALVRGSAGTALGDFAEARDRRALWATRGCST